MIAKAEAAAKPLGAAGAWVVVAALVAGLAGGMAVGGQGTSTSIASTVGGLWLDALKMTVIPLMIALLIKGVVGSASIAAQGRVTGRALAWFIGLYLLSAVAGALLMPALLNAFPLSPAAAEAVRSGFAAVDPASVQGSVAGAGDFIRSFIPSNLFAAAADGSILQLVVFTLLFALAVARLDASKREPVVAFFGAVSEAMLVLIGWVLLFAPVGVFMLAFVAGAASGSALFWAVAQFIALYVGICLAMILIAYGIAVAAGGFGAAAFARAMAPTQAIAFSTQSSTGSLPVMFLSARRLGVSDSTADVVLPLAAALFRFTGPAMNIAVVIFIARMTGMQLGAGAFAAGIAIASVATISAPGLPGQVSYFTSIAPIAMAMGVPLAPLAMLIAVEPVPDMFRTVGNVTMDVAVTGAVGRTRGGKRR